MTCESVDLPEPFGPMIACTSPGFTVRDSPWRISRSSTRTCRFFTSSNDILISFPNRHPEVRAAFGEPRGMVFVFAVILRGLLRRHLRMTTSVIQPNLQG